MSTENWWIVLFFVIVSGMVGYIIGFLDCQHIYRKARK